MTETVIARLDFRQSHPVPKLSGLVQNGNKKQKAKNCQNGLKKMTFHAIPIQRINSFQNKVDSSFHL